MKRSAPSTPSRYTRIAVVLTAIVLLAGCGSRQVQDSLVGSTAQRLVSYSIDDMARKLPAHDFAPYAGERVHLTSHFLQNPEIKHYADRRLAMELAHRFDIEVVSDPLMADARLNIFYTSLGTDQGFRGFYIPLGFMPGLSEGAHVSLLTLEQFRGVSEMYYYIGETGTEMRGNIIQASTRSDALGLPIITIPISTIDRR